MAFIFAIFDERKSFDAKKKTKLIFWHDFLVLFAMYVIVWMCLRNFEVVIHSFMWKRPIQDSYHPQKQIRSSFVPALFVTKKDTNNEDGIFVYTDMYNCWGI